MNIISKTRFAHEANALNTAVVEYLLDNYQIVDSYIKEAISEKLNVEAKDKIKDMELLAKLQTSESILGSRILRNFNE